MIKEIKLQSNQAISEDDFKEIAEMVEREILEKMSSYWMNISFGNHSIRFWLIYKTYKGKRMGKPEMITENSHLVILQNAVKEKILEMIKKYTEHLKTPLVDNNSYLRNRCEGKIDALETLVVELKRNCILLE